VVAAVAVGEERVGRRGSVAAADSNKLRTVPLLAAAGEGMAAEGRRVVGG
jgi:hypothetical protein